MGLNLRIYVFVERPTSDHSKHVEKKAEELKKDAEKYESSILAKLKQMWNRVKSSLITTKAYVEQKGASGASSARILACKTGRQLQNPVILVNVLLGSSFVTALLTGYAKYDARYLRDKSDAVILTTVGSITAILALDTVLSVKYYPKFDKKK